MSLGNRIYTLRSGLGLSQRTLAEKLGISQQTVSKWENDSAVPELQKLLALADILGVTADQLVTGDTPPEKPNLPPVSGLTVPLYPNQTAGLMLIAVSIAGMLLRDIPLFSWRLGSWTLLPCLLCGVLCLFTKRHTAFWCGWALYLTVDAAILYTNWTKPWDILAYRHGIYGWQRCDMDLWVQVLGLAAAVLATIWYVRQRPLRIPCRLRWGLACSAYISNAAIMILIRQFRVQMLDVTEGWCEQLWICTLAAALSLTFARTGECPAPDHRQPLGERISTLRTEHHLSQDDLAEKLNISRQAVSKWETGNATPELEKLLAMSQLFGCPLEWLLRGNEPVKAERRVFFSAGQLLGLGLLGWGTFELFRHLNLYEREIGLVFPLLLFLGGTLCFCKPDRTGLWGSWTAALLLNALIRNNALGGAARLLPVRPYYIDLPSSLTELAFELVLLLLTLYSFRRTELPLTRRNRALLAGSWGLWALLEAYIWCYAYPMTAPRYPDHYTNPDVNFRIFVDFLSLFCFAAALALTVAALRARRRQNPGKTAADAP